MGSLLAAFIATWELFGGLNLDGADANWHIRAATRSGFLRGNPPDQPAHGLRREAGISFITMCSVVCQRHRPSCELF